MAEQATASKFTIPFTQYLKPDGRKQAVEFDVTTEMGEKAQVIIEYGWRFEVEELTTMEASLTVFDPEDEVDVSIEVVQNGPPVVPAVDRLILDAYQQLLGIKP